MITPHCLLVPLIITHASFSTSLLSWFYLYATFPLLSTLLCLEFAHHHGTFSRADSIIDILCADNLALLVHAPHRCWRKLPGSPLGHGLQGKTWRGGDRGAAGAGHPLQCSITPGSLGWLEMKEAYLVI